MSSELAEIFSPVPDVPVLAQILAIGITMFCKNLFFGRLGSAAIVLLEALPMINVPC